MFAGERGGKNMDNREARRARHLLVAAAIVLILGLAVPPVSVRAHNPTVKVSVDASEFFGNPLTYHWRATDGHIVDQNSPTTDWTLPNGPGIHFAYVLVSNGKGGYTEGRIAVNTDDNPPNTVVPRDQYPAAASKIFSRAGKGVFQPPAPASDVPLDDGTGTIQGQLGLGDASSCGKRIPFFGVDVTAILELRNKDGMMLSQTALNPYAFGQFTLKDVTDGTQLFAICETATMKIENFDRTGKFPDNRNFFFFNDTTQPEVNSMSATRNGRSVGIFPVPPTPPRGTLPSDFFGRLDHKVLGTPRFLSFKGLDSRTGSCEYYKAIGAVVDCDDAGNFKGAVLNFKDWRKSVQIGEFKQTTGGFPNEPEAVFINEVDLNLTRDHHSIAYGPDDVAAYVCNHPGAASDPAIDPTGLFPPPSDVDTAIDNVLKADNEHPQGRNLVACVAMDTRRQPFTSFLIFGPNGDLLPSVNLDGTGEKFVPGACVACHGGNNYFALANDTFPNAPGASAPIYGGFPATGTATPDLQSYFLPYDVENFRFSSKSPNTRADLEGPIFELNKNAFLVDRDIAVQNGRSDISAAFGDLFNRWYPPGTMVFMDNAPPPSSVPTYAGEGDSFYRNVVARSCRTCHVAMDGANFETKDPALLSRNLVCGESFLNLATDLRTPSYVMPNAQVTFDRFWLSARGQPSGANNQPETLEKHINFLVPPSSALKDCRLGF
jgi:hypothetical protein